MSDSISIQQLFTAGLTREEFIQRYTELQTSGEISSASIFIDNYINSIGEIYDILNSNQNDTLDEEEIETLRKMGDEDNTTISEADMKALYTQVGKKIMEKYDSQTTPEQMYQRTANGDAQSNTYVQDSSQEIAILEELITLRNVNSATIKKQIQSQIDNLIKKDSKITNELKTKYIELAEKVTALEEEADRNSERMRKINEDIRNNNNLIRLTQAKIDRLNPEDESDEKAIASKKKELEKLMSNNEDLNFELGKLESKQNSVKKAIKKTKQKKSKINDKIISSNPDIKVKLGEYNLMLKQEEDSADNEISAYTAQIEKLQHSQTYAIEQQITLTAPTQVQSSNGSTVSVTEAYHNNDNLTDFSQLESLGLKYSTDKGQYFASQILRNLVGFTKHCSRYVSDALANSGLGNERRGSAADMAGALRENHNFQEIKVNSAADLKKLPAGCILVYDRGAAGYNSKHGHIEVTLGDGTAGSDGRTRNIRYSDRMSVFVPVENLA